MTNSHRTTLFDSVH